MVVPPPQDFWLKCHFFCAAVHIILMCPISDLHWGLVTVLNWPVIVLTDSNRDVKRSVLWKLWKKPRRPSDVSADSLILNVIVMTQCVPVKTLRAVSSWTASDGYTAWTNHILRSDCTCQGLSFWFTHRMWFFFIQIVQTGGKKELTGREDVHMECEL